MAVDILYVSFNRLEYTRETFSALLEHTDWDEVAGLFVADDRSTDGTAAYLADAIADVPDRVVVHMNSGKFHGPVAAMNWYLDHASPGVEMFAKVDNDMVVCPGWLSELLRVMHLYPGLDILGMEPFVGDPTMPPLAHRTYTEAPHIGGKGLIRHRAFSQCRPVANGYHGFTQWQEKHEHISKGWITPDLPVFGLDQVRDADGPWAALARGYAEKGWQRLWPVYAGDEHYTWWLEGRR